MRARRTHGPSADSFAGLYRFSHGNIERAEYLKQTRAALGKEWQPKGTTAEGDVKKKQHAETSPLHRFWGNWNGNEVPQDAFDPLSRHLQELQNNPR